MEGLCASPDGRSFNSYFYNVALKRHVIISELAPFGDAASPTGVGTLEERRGELTEDLSQRPPTLIPSSN